MIIGRRHLDHVGANDIDVDGTKTAQKRQRLAARQSAGDGRAGAGGESRIEAIDIERAIGRAIADPLPNPLQNAGDAEAVEGIRG